MIVKFNTKNSADIIMMEKDARVVLNLIGRSYDVTPEHGVITPEQMPEAMATLKEIFQSRKQAAQDAVAVSEPEDQDEQHGEAHDPVLLHQRAWPLYEMMQVAQQEGDDIVWHAESGY